MTEGTVEYQVSRDAHECHTPGWRERRKLDLGFGSVWRCRCGIAWKWSGFENGSWWDRILEAESDPASPDLLDGVDMSDVYVPKDATELAHLSILAERIEANRRDPSQMVRRRRQ